MKKYLLICLLSLSSTSLLAQNIQCVTKTEIGEDFKTKANLYERDTNDSNRSVSNLDLTNLTVTNADTNMKMRLVRIGENIYENRDGQFVWRFVINSERTIVVETGLTGQMVIVKILRCR